jgi:hypothetical protein
VDGNVVAYLCLFGGLVWGLRSIERRIDSLDQKLDRIYDEVYDRRRPELDDDES